MPAIHQVNTKAFRTIRTLVLNEGVLKQASRLKKLIGSVGPLRHLIADVHQSHGDDIGKGTKTTDGRLIAHFDVTNHAVTVWTIRGIPFLNPDPDPDDPSPNPGGAGMAEIVYIFEEYPPCEVTYEAGNDCESDLFANTEKVALLNRALFRLLSKGADCKSAGDLKRYIFEIHDAATFSKSLPRLLADAIGQQRAERMRPHVHVCTTDQVNHGKTTLTICQQVAEYDGTAKICGLGDNVPGEKARIVTDHVESESYNRYYAFVDCLGLVDYVKNLITGAAHIDNSIEGCSAYDGPMDQTRGQTLQVGQLDVPYTVVYLHKADMANDAALLELVEIELCELLLEMPDRLIGQLSLAPVEDVFSILGRVTVTFGLVGLKSVERVPDKAQVAGSNSSLARIESIGIRATTEMTVAGMGMFRKLLDSDSIDVLLHGTRHDEVEHDQEGLCSLGAITLRTKSEAEIYVRGKDLR